MCSDLSPPNEAYHVTYQVQNAPPPPPSPTAATADLWRESSHGGAAGGRLQQPPASDNCHQHQQCKYCTETRGLSNVPSPGQ